MQLSLSINFCLQNITYHMLLIGSFMFTSHHSIIFLFVCCYFLQWPLFFTDILQCVARGSKTSVELYLRVLKAIDEEVVDRNIIHSQEVTCVNHLGPLHHVGN